MNHLLLVMGIVIVVTVPVWPMAHYDHACPPMDTWNGAICPTARVMELSMFLQLAIGFIMAAFSAPQ